MVLGLLELDHLRCQGRFEICQSNQSLGKFLPGVLLLKGLVG